MKPTGITKGKAGFTLLEVILAMALFGAAALGLCQALNLIGATVVESAEIGWRQELVNSYLTEASRRSEIRPGKDAVNLENRGLRIEVSTEPLELTNMDGEPLRDMFRITVVATDSAGEIVETAETYRYLPFYSEIQER